MILPTTHYKLQTQSGYIALMSAIIISILLLAITVNLGFNGFFGRFNILDSESKERSSALAEACVDTAVLNLAQGSTPSPLPANISVGSESCKIFSVQYDTPVLDQATIKTQAVINKAHTNLQVIINNNFEIISWKECPTFSSCP